MLLDIDRRRLTRRADSDNGIGSFLYMVINQTTQTWQIKASVLVHRRDDGNQGTGNGIHGKAPRKLNFRF